MKVDWGELSKISTWVSIISIVVAILVLIAIKDSIQEMKTANELTWKNIEMSHRPFLGLEYCKEEISKDTMTIMVRMKNVGATPANRISVYFKALGKFKGTTEAKPTWETVIPPTMSVSYDFWVTTTPIEKILGPGKEFKFKIEFEYQGVDTSMGYYSTCYEVLRKNGEFKAVGWSN